MNKNRLLKKGLVLGIIVLFIGASIIPSTVGINEEKTSFLGLNPFENTLYVGGSGQNNYSSIQAAIDDANNGDTVFVYNDSSPYHENVIVNKSINLIGEDKNTTIIIGDGSGSVIFVYADSVNISGFTVTRGFRGITLNSANHCNISNNIASNNDDYGIYLEYLDNNNTITSNNVNNNAYGIRLDESDDNTITGNNVSNNTNGIRLDFSSNNNRITGNTVNKNEGGGIKLRESNNNHITENNISDSHECICFYNDCNQNIISYNSLTNTNSVESQRYIGINQKSNNNTFYMNTIENYGDINFRIAFQVLTSDNNNFSRNTIINVYTAFNVVHSYNNTFFMNNIINCTIGFSIDEGNNKSASLQINQKNNPNKVINNNIQGVAIKGFSRFTFSLETIWEGNYWGRPRILPKVIIGFKMITELLGFPSKLEFDWRPAKKPYDIPQVCL